MSRTTAVPLDELAAANPGELTGQPLCPLCKQGYLQPYVVSIGLGTQGRRMHGVVELVGWTAVCVGNQDYLSAKYAALAADGDAEVPALVGSLPCGFSMSMSPHQT